MNINKLKSDLIRQVCIQPVDNFKRIVNDEYSIKIEDVNINIVCPINCQTVFNFHDVKTGKKVTLLASDWEGYFSDGELISELTLRLRKHFEKQDNIDYEKTIEKFHKKLVK